MGFGTQRKFEVAEGKPLEENKNNNNNNKISLRMVSNQGLKTRPHWWKRGGGGNSHNYTSPSVLPLWTMKSKLTTYICCILRSRLPRRSFESRFGFEAWQPLQYVVKFLLLADNMDESAIQIEKCVIWKCYCSLKQIKIHLLTHSSLHSSLPSVV